MNVCARTCACVYKINFTNIKKVAHVVIAKGLGMVVHACNPSYSEGVVRRIKV
jgi:hypothetical protein